MIAAPVLSIWFAPPAQCRTTSQRQDPAGPVRGWGIEGKDGGKQFGRSVRAGYLSRHRRSGRCPDDQIGLGHIQPGVKQAGDDADRPGIA